MNCGEVATIIKYNKATDIMIKFEGTGEQINCEYGDFKKGMIKSHFSPSVFGIGIVGLTLTVDEKGKQLDSYHNWIGMIDRCYNKKHSIKRPTYAECKVCNKWLTYSTFKKWYDNNYYEIEEEKMCLDKDILFKGNKIYSPETCIYVPNRINVLFTKRQNERGKFPIGVDFIKKNNNYRSRCNYEKNVSVYLGSFSTPEEAFMPYKIYKEQLIKSIADIYKNKIPKNLYNAMYYYKIEMTD